MAFLFNVNNGVSTFSETLFDIVADMITQGWRVRGSGDGLAAFENDGQTAGSGGGSGGAFHVFTSGGAGALGMDNGEDLVSGAWLRLAAPLASDWPDLEYLWTRGNLPDVWRLRASIGGVGFNSGGSPTDSPTAPDGVSLAGNQVRQNASTDFRTFVPSGAVNMHWAIGDSAERFGFFAWNLRASNSGVWGVWGLDPVASLPPGSDPPNTQDPLSFVHLVSHSSSSGSTFDSFDLGSTSGFYFPSSGTERIEDMGPGAEIVERGCFAHFGYGEPGPPGYAGLYRVAPEVGGQGNGIEGWHESMGPDLTSGRQLHLIGRAYLRFDISNTVNFYKGVGQLLGHTFSTGPDVDDDGASARFKNSGTSVPWPQGVGFIL